MAKPRRKEEAVKTLLPFGAFIMRDVGFRSRTTLLYVSDNEAHAKNMADLEKTHATSRGYVIETKVRRVTARELAAWRLAGNYVPKKERTA